LIPKELQAEFEEKRTMGIKESWNKGTYGQRISKKTLRKAKITAPVKTKEQIAEEKKKEDSETQSLIHKILGDENFKAADLVEEMKVAGTNFKVDPKMRKFVFMQWFLADAKTRTPENIYELCKILEMPLSEGRAWMEADWFVSDLLASNLKLMKLAMPHMGRLLLVRAIGQNDLNAAKEFVKTFGKHEKKEGDTDWNDLFGEDILNEAGEVLGEAN
jgi:hypothetical protein